MGELTPAHKRVYERLKKVRASKTVSLKPCSLLRDTITGFDGKPEPFKLRYYQVQAVYHMLVLKRMVLGEDTGLGKCQPFDSLVLTDHGLIPMGEIEDWSEMEPDSFRPMSRPIHVLVDGGRLPIKSFYNGGVKSTITATTRYGFKNTGSQVHPMLVLREGQHQWVKARDLNEGDYLCVERRKMPFPEAEPSLVSGPGPERMTPSLARFLGYYVGEGGLTSKYQVRVSQSPSVNPEIHADILRLFRENFGRDPLRPDVPDLYLSDVKLRKWLKAIGLGYTLSSGREVPPCVLQATERSNREFLRALFEGEGHAGRTHIEYSTASEELGRQVQVMLLRFGVVANRSPKHVKGRDHIYWRLTICGGDACQFQEEIGFISSRKQEALWACLDRPRNPNHDVVPEAPWIFEKVRVALLGTTSRRGANDLRKGSGLKQFGVSFVKTLNNIRNYGRSPTYAFIEKTAGLLREHAPDSEALALLEGFLTTRYFYDPIVSLEDGEEEVFDIEVDHPDHAFVGNGFINHNTIETLAALCYLWENNEAANKVIVVAPKSAMRQWAGELERFTTGVKAIVAGSRAPNPVADCTCLNCGNTWQTKATGKKIVCKKCKTAWAKVQKDDNGAIIAPEPITVKRESPVDVRREDYAEWAKPYDGEGGPRKVLITNYALLVRDWNHGGFQPPTDSGDPDYNKPVIPGLLDKTTASVGKDTVVVYDECFDYYTPITLADGSTEIIGKIVCGRMPVEVLSWNWRRGQVEARKVTRWIRNPLKKQGRQRLLKIKFKYARSCRVTKTHKFYRRDGTSVRALDLKPGRETAFLALAPSVDQLQIVLGSLLGDASISHPKRVRWGVIFTHGEDQITYLDYKHRALSSLGVSEIDEQSSGYGGKPIYRFRLKANPSLCSSFRLHDGRRKRLTADWLDALTPLGLAVWYGDDGSLQTYICKDGSTTYNIRFSTNGFTFEEHQLLAGWLWWRWGIRAQIKPTKSYLYLYLDDQEAKKFLKLLPGALPGVEYKFPGKSLVSMGDARPRQELVRDEVISVTEWERDRKPERQFVYDLEVEGNHNYLAGGTLVSNCTAFKSDRTKTWEYANFLSQRAHRVYGLTATLLKNRLMEGYCIFRVIKPGVFTTKTKFYEEFCYTELKKVPRSTVRIRIVLGYKNLDRFRERIDPVFLGRKKHMVTDELPTLTTREVIVELSSPEDAKYGEALSGILELGDGDIRDYDENKALVSLTYCQQVVDSLRLLKFDEGDVVESGMAFDPKKMKVGKLGTKEQALVDLITGELDDEKIIVYTRFASLVPRLQAILKREGIKSAAITGKVSGKKRAAAQDAFQNMESDTKVIFITAAGTEALNLQAAIATVFYDLPWSWGDYLQALGRMIRIGSPHQKVLAYHLVAYRPNRGKKDSKTIDHHVLGLLRNKRNFIDKILGEGAVGALKFDRSSSIIDLVRQLQEDAKQGKSKSV